MAPDNNSERQVTKGRVRRTLRTLLPSCREASRRQSAALDHPLGFWERIGLGFHLALCKWCRRYGRQLRFLHHATQEHPEHWEEAAPHRLSDEARQRLKESLRSSKK